MVWNTQQDRGGRRSRDDEITDTTSLEERIDDEKMSSISKYDERRSGVTPPSIDLPPDAIVIDHLNKGLQSPSIQDLDVEKMASALPHRQDSFAPSTRSRMPVIVPKSKRRGLFAHLTLIPEVERPYDYEDRVKWIITGFIAILGCAAPMGSAIFYPALPELSRDFQTSPTIVNLSVALYMLAMSIFPLWWSSFSETLGRRTIYLTSFLLNVIFSLLSGLSVNIAMLIVFRVLSGGAAAAVQAVGAGTIADLWEPAERGRAMGFFYLGPLMGPLLAPIISGSLTSAFGWRSTMWFLTAFGVLIFVIILFGVPETLSRQTQLRALAAMKSNPTPTSTDTTPPSVPIYSAATDTEPAAAPLSRPSSVHVRTRKVSNYARRIFLEPLSILSYLRFPPVVLTVYYAAITFGSLYVVNISIQAAFSSPPYSYPPLVIGVLYIPSSLGYALTSIFGGRWIDRIAIREAVRKRRFDARGKPIILPEDRMRENAWLAAALYPAAILFYGWSVQKGLHWAVPSVANLLFGVGSMLVFSAATTMLTEFMPRRSSSGVALNNFARNILSATGGVIGQPLVDLMGHGWLATAVAILAWTSGFTVIWLLRRNSERWRKRMDEALEKEDQ